MNKSLETVNETTTNPIVKVWSQFLIDNAGKRFLATFKKKSGEIREMLFVPRNQYNTMMGIESTEWGKRMVRSKAINDMLTVVEFYRPQGCLGYHEAVQCRTLNLGTLISLKVA